MTTQQPERPGRTRQPLCIALAVNALLFAAVYVLWTPRFATNDDVAMMLQAAGVSSDSQATAYLLWTNVAIGGPLKGLYAVAPAVPWYPLYLVKCLFLAHVAVLWVLLRQERWVRALALYLSYFLVIGAHLLLNLQFTTVGCAASGAGLLLLLSMLEEPAPGPARGRALPAAAAILLIALGSMIRWLSFALAVLMFLPVLALRVRPQRAKGLLFPLAAFAAAMALSLALHAADRAARGRDEGWRLFTQYDPLLCRFVDDNVLEGRTEENLRATVGKVGWSVNDYRMFYRYWFLDQRVFPISRLRALLATVPAVKTEITLARALRTGAGILSERWAWHALAVAVLALLWRRAGRAAWAEVAVSALAAGALVLYLVYARRPPPPRVYLPMFVFVAWVGLVQRAGAAWAGGWSKAARRVALGVAAVLLLVAARWALASHRWQARENRADQAALRAALRRLAPAPGQLYVVWGAAFPWPHLAPFATLDALRGFKTFSLGSAELTPGPQRTLREFGLRDLHLALADNGNIFFLCDLRGMFPLYRAYMMEHYGVEVTAETVFESESFPVFKVRRAGGGRPATNG